MLRLRSVRSCAADQCAVHGIGGAVSFPARDTPPTSSNHHSSATSLTIFKTAYQMVCHPKYGFIPSFMFVNNPYF